jgi:glycosyltransferase involved in cell wall biosynthesis
MVTVSVLIRSYGRQAALAHSIASVKLQTYKDYEIIVVEDGNATLNTFLGGYSDIPLYYLPQLERRGRSAASNFVLAAAKGDYCVFLDEGDEFYADHLELLMAHVKQTGCKIAYSWSEERTVARAANGAITKRSRWRRWRRENFSLLHLVAGDFPPTCAVLFHHSLFELSGGFDTELHSYQDAMFWLRLAALEANWECVKQATAIYHVPFRQPGTKKARAASTLPKKMEACMANLPIAWPMLSLSHEMKRYFGLNMFLRKWSYYLTSFIR